MGPIIVEIDRTDKKIKLNPSKFFSRDLEMEESLSPAGQHYWIFPVDPQRRDDVVM